MPACYWPCSPGLLLPWPHRAQWRWLGAAAGTVVREGRGLGPGLVEAPSELRRELEPGQASRSAARTQSCTGPGNVKSDPAATALGLLPFLAAGQTHESKGPYKKVVFDGLNWLMQHQETNGNLAKET